MLMQPETKIDFLIIGAAKCATTWLQMSLAENPSVFMPEPELHYFSREYHRGSDWYRAQFAEAGAATIIGEKSNSYLTEEPSAERIAHDLPHVKLIVQLRDPVQRAYSSYCMHLRRGAVTKDIRRYLDPDRKADGDRFLDRGFMPITFRSSAICLAMIASWCWILIGSAMPRKRRRSLWRTISGWVRRWYRR